MHEGAVSPFLLTHLATWPFRYSPVHDGQFVLKSISSHMKEEWHRSVRTRFDEVSGVKHSLQWAALQKRMKSNVAP